MTNYYCKYCGSKAPTVSSLASATCVRHPSGPLKGRHALYEGGEKSQYTCKHCGTKASTLSGLTSAVCHRHPDGANKGRHEPAV